MDEKGVCLGLVEAGGDNLYPMYLGIACALFAFKGFSEKGLDDERWCYMNMREKMLQGGAHLLGLLFWREKCRNLATEIQQLKRRRAEDGRANERVASIYAAQQQRWFGERKSLRQQIGALLNHLRIVDATKHDQIREMDTKLQKMELALNTKNSLLETLVEELRESAKQEAQVHASELWKHKSAFIELVSNQRQLQAELGRARRQAVTARHQLDFVFQQRQESVFMLQKLSMELENVRKDSEHKDKILSAMLGKSKLDAEAKQMLLKEVKLSKARRKHAEMDKCKRHTLRSMLRKQANSRLAARGANNTNPDVTDFARDLIDDETEATSYSSHSDDKCLAQRDEELADVKQVDGWVCLRAGKYRTTPIEQKHQQEVEPFSEQIRQKDEKLEAYHWRSLNMELESKRLSSQLEGLNQSILQLRHNKLKLETLLVERETELKSLKDSISMHFNSLNKQRNKFHSSRLELPLGDEMVWSKVRDGKKKTAVEADKCLLEVPQQVEPEKEEETGDAMKNGSSCMKQCSVEDTKGSEEDHQGLVLAREEASREGIEIMQKDVSIMNEPLIKERSFWKMDIQALGVSYKIKCLKQQLVMLERLKGKQEVVESSETEDKDQIRMKGFHVLLLLLKKQVARYHSLQEKTDDLCKRMRDKDLDANKRDSNSMRTKEDSTTLEHFLEETFQLQRFIVAAGQKLMEIHSKIMSGFIAAADNFDGPTSFGMRRFSDNLQGLFREVQRGIEVRIARIIGDLEGTLACDGIRLCRQ